MGRRNNTNRKGFIDTWLSQGGIKFLFFRIKPKTRQAGEKQQGECTRWMRLVMAILIHSIQSYDIKTFETKWTKTVYKMLISVIVVVTQSLSTFHTPPPSTTNKTTTYFPPLTSKNETRATSERWFYHRIWNDHLAWVFKPLHHSANCSDIWRIGWICRVQYVEVRVSVARFAWLGCL